MAEILKGKPVADAMIARMHETAEALKAKGVEPTLCVVRVGERADDLFYEKSVMKRCSAVGIRLRQVILPDTVTQAAFEEAFEAVNRDPKVHGRRNSPRHHTQDTQCRLPFFRRLNQKELPCHSCQP